MTAEPHDAAPYPPRVYAWCVLAILIGTAVLSYTDRQVLSLLVDPLRHDLGISDTRVGLLQGLSFALFYTIMGLPLGRLADTRSRRNLIAAGVLIWSVMTSCGSLARTFWTLAFTRLGVGIGEATLSPAAFSMIEKILGATKIEREQIEMICVGLGPGSYTGIRAAIAMAQGWQLARGTKLLGVSSVASLAEQAGAFHPSEIASQLVLLYDGASVSAQMDHNPGAALMARGMAEQILAAACAPRPH